MGCLARFFSPVLLVEPDLRAAALLDRNTMMKWRLDETRARGAIECAKLIGSERSCGLSTPRLYQAFPALRTVPSSRSVLCRFRSDCKTPKDDQLYFGRMMYWKL